MTHASPGGFRAVLRAELLRNARRPAPYVMIALFVANAWLWWARGAADYYGWATNSEYYIARLFSGFSFLTLPLCTAVLMGDPVIRDFAERVDPLLFSKPLGRASYLLGKFLGSFLVLVACQAAFALALVALQAVRPAGMLVGPPRVVPYLQHFLAFVVVSHLALAAVHFAVGTLTRSTRAVYALAVGFYPLYAAYGIQLTALPGRWRVALDPLLLNWYGEVARGRSAAWLNALDVRYDVDLLLNRAAVVCLALACLAVVVLRFDPRREAALPAGGERAGLAVLGVGAPGAPRAPNARRAGTPSAAARWARALLPAGARDALGLVAAAVGVELRLLRAEQSLTVLAPLAVTTALLGPLVYGVRGAAADGTASARYAHAPAGPLLLLLLGLVVFYTGEAMHRDREARVEPLLWSTPAPDAVLLLPKFVASLLLALTLLLGVASGAAALQLWRGAGPLDVAAYAWVYLAILAPTAACCAAASVLLHVVVRDKSAAYLVSVGVVSALFYLFGQGHTHWSYNVALHGLWGPADLDAVGTRRAALLIHRVYCVAIGAACLALAHLRFARRSSGRQRPLGPARRDDRARAVLLASVGAALVAAAAVARLGL